ncbi:hypothetical protein FRB99_006013 [Tulasnella sp. 403]|nr:hypothetical protein FRB99_006013 [Tulasnella sp. 403]
MSATNNPTIAERNEIHRSAKALEQIIALFHDYCQTVSASASVQKKLAKAMKDASNVKGTHSTVANAFASAGAMFEILADVDGKFSRVCEREYEGLSAELKKWFKKMAKEEKNHDDYAYGVQSRLKLATQGFDKKTKSRFPDTVADHTRYVNQINSLTNELNQARIAHSTYVNQKHTSVLFFAGATVTRLSDAEWVRSCEEVRKCAVTIGREKGPGGKPDGVSDDGEGSNANRPPPPPNLNDNGSDLQVPGTPTPAYTTVAPLGPRPLPTPSPRQSTLPLPSPAVVPPPPPPLPSAPSPTMSSDPPSVGAPSRSTSSNYSSTTPATLPPNSPISPMAQQTPIEVVPPIKSASTERPGNDANAYPFPQASEEKYEEREASIPTPRRKTPLQYSDVEVPPARKDDIPPTPGTPISSRNRELPREMPREMPPPILKRDTGRQSDRPQSGRGSDGQDERRDSRPTFAPPTAFADPSLRERGHTSRRSRDWAEEGDILEDRDREGTRRRRQEELELEERESVLRNRERELERRARELERERDHLFRDQYMSDREAGVRTSSARREREGVGARWRNDMPSSPTPRRTYSPPSLSASTRSNTAAAESNALGHASSCGCYECSAKHYASSSARPPPLSIKNGDRTRYIGSNSQYASSTASLSNHPATSPVVATRPLSAKSSQILSASTSAVEGSGSTKEKKGVFANLKRLSMGAAFAAGTLDAGGTAVRTLMSPTIEEERSFGSNKSHATSLSPQQDKRTSTMIGSFSGRR